MARQLQWEEWTADEPPLPTPMSRGASGSGTSGGGGSGGGGGTRHHHGGSGGGWVAEGAFLLEDADMGAGGQRYGGLRGAEVHRRIGGSSGSGSGAARGSTGLVGGGGGGPPYDDGDDGSSGAIAVGGKSLAAMTVRAQPAALVSRRQAGLRLAPTIVLPPPHSLSLLDPHSKRLHAAATAGPQPGPVDAMP